MGKPDTPEVYHSCWNKIEREGEQGEPKHPSNLKEKKEEFDSLSSGERKGNSPNFSSVKACRRCLRGVVGLNISNLLVRYGVKNSVDS